ncbi:uncharacterized protein LOC106132806 [Amyelois transitella]|uniref:uncharacterized protein LOC106132806 n=1 Tax=Amyelois transitella TaxID=680683 RepID=UPI0029904ABF|nr:uncharacterized protein LOC106132806 [Amyelois transitella]
MEQHVAEHVAQQLRGMCRDTCRGTFCRPHFSVFIEMSPEEVVAISAAYIVIISSVLKRKRKRRWWMRNFLLQRERRVNILSDLRMSDGSFVNFTRMSSSDFETLLQMIASSIAKQDTILRNAISPHIRLAITLRYLSTGDSYASLSYTFRVSKQLIRKIVPEVCKELINKLKICVKVPATANEWKAKARSFENIWNFPHCVGSIDGKHVLIQAPSNSGSDYFNYKEQFSIVLLGIVDANYNFIYANCGAKEKSSDSGVFQETAFYKALADNQLNWPTPDPIRQDGPNMPYVLVGDSAFALTENMMKPYPGNHDVGTTRRIFNYRLSRARRIVENVFGILGVVFRIFRTPITILPCNAELVVMACIYLHNFLRRNSQSRSLYNPHGTFDSENVDHDILEGSWRREAGSVNMSNLNAMGRRYPESAMEIRNKFAEYFMSEEGRVPWQNNF